MSLKRSLKRIKRVIFIQDEIRKILSLPRDQSEVKLRQLAQELGCALDSTYHGSGKHLTEEVIKRIQEAARTWRESHLWLIAVISALASLASAIAAWCAVLLTR